MKHLVFALMLPLVGSCGGARVGSAPQGVPSSAPAFASEVEQVERAVVRLLKQNKHAEALRLLLDLTARREFPQLSLDKRSGIFYDIAYAHAVLGNKPKAVAYLTRAIDAGFADHEHVGRDSDRVGLHADDAFLQSLASVYHQLLLARWSRFGDEADPRLPPFEYQPAEHPDLRRLREQYHLDEVAGQGDELSRIFNVLKWAHTIVRHDGQHAWHGPRNALSLITGSRARNRGINCRMMAIILNEAYLALGFTSRFITCLPKWEGDPDCHVVVMVFVDKLAKWVLVDPTFQVMLTDEQGTPLSPEELRQRLASNAAIRFVQDPDYNGKPYSREQYLEYMAKNTFRFSCPVVSASGYESSPPPHSYIELEPVGYARKAAAPADRSTVRTFVTHDAARFWGKPRIMP